MEMRRPEQLATRLLLRQRRLNLRFDISRLDFDREILFGTLQHFCATTKSSMREMDHPDLRDGMTLRLAGPGGPRYVVLRNEEADNRLRRRFTLAHEIGHIYLDHIDDGVLQEDEADAFAAQLLMPRILVERLVRLWGGRVAAGDLAELFGVSLPAAKNRLCGQIHPARYGEEDRALLRRMEGLLPRPNEPLITI